MSKTDLNEIISWVKSNADPVEVKGMARFGISSKEIYGVSIKKIRPFAKVIGKNHSLALQLWKTGIHEARLIAPMIDEPAKVTIKQIESWVKDFNSWDICDQCCSNLFDKTEFAYSKAVEWSARKEEFTKRAGFVLMAVLSVHDKKADDITFEKFLPLILRESTDERNFVKKAVNWALRQIGKRNLNLNKTALQTAEEILALDSKAAKWIARDAIKELTEGKMIARLREKKRNPVAPVSKRGLRD